MRDLLRLPAALQRDAALQPRDAARLPAAGVDVGVDQPRPDGVDANTVLGYFLRQADVSSEPEVVRLFAETDTALGRVTALVNNAGIIGRQGRLADLDAARMTRLFAVNVVGSIVCAREAVQRMSTRRGGPGGSIVNVSSMAARLGAPGEYLDYAASKGCWRRWRSSHTTSTN